MFASEFDRAAARFERERIRFEKAQEAAYKVNAPEGSSDKDAEDVQGTV